MELSTRRAESVKSWLVAAMAIPADRVQTRGFGKFRLIAPASGSIDEQQINRRVEIVIRPNTNN
jgi:outer membrane protein OmpA-like peptidoglycan-associated protein